MNRCNAAVNVEEAVDNKQNLMINLQRRQK